MVLVGLVGTISETRIYSGQGRGGMGNMMGLVQYLVQIFIGRVIRNWDGTGWHIQY